MLQRIARIRPELHKTGSWMLLHDNAPAHSAIRVRQFLAQHGVVVIEHPPYSPDLAPADFFLFPRLKNALKGARFDDVDDIKTTVTTILQTIPSDAFFASFHNLFERCHRCVERGGDYFEGQ